MFSISVVFPERLPQLADLFTEIFVVAKRYKLHKHTTTQGIGVPYPEKEMEMLKKSGFDVRECIFSYQKFSVIVAIKPQEG